MKRRKNYLLCENDRAFASKFATGWKAGMPSNATGGAAGCYSFWTRELWMNRRLTKQQYEELRKWHADGTTAAYRY